MEHTAAAAIELQLARCCYSNSFALTDNKSLFAFPLTHSRSTRLLPFTER